MKFDLSKTTRHTRTNSFGWMFQRIAGQFMVEMKKQLAPFDLTIEQFAALMTVMEHDGVTQRQIGEHISMPAYAISRALDHLEKIGFVERVAHPTSRRAVHVVVTPRAKDIAPQIFGVVDRVNDELIGILDDGQTDTLRLLLQSLLRAPKP
ncbi:MarR family transcriptional regulator [Octadecabacter sp. 1_MG-2023]|uniref:MarR family winged helix-turn-helix transcriptional regulator n=1 Tax=unclassified Octadecabacter TaxID=196158 RepID=UPI001C086FAE|nr:MULTISPECIES: MarR family transcriptional regulator [unclassified Octadecabacter]MBU2992423.1 MarR family transcriptional regulator [Octadecabacter sp. B2R22]MDO6734820.1 MarR family transcriptional regulator [Octadecabacter sp. 1_MG-2023]